MLILHWKPPSQFAGFMLILHWTILTAKPFGAIQRFVCRMYGRMQVLRGSNSIVTVFAIAALFALPARAADKPEASWENVQQLKAGQGIQIVRTDLKSVTGHFVSVAADSLILKTTAGEQTLNRVDINRITRSGGKRGRNALIGAAAGGGAGAVVGAASGGCHPGEFICLGRGTVAAILAGLGILAGAALGVAIPGHTTIYRAK